MEAHLRAEIGISCVLQHLDVVAYANGERTTETLADDCADNRRLQTSHCQQITGNRLALATLFGVHTGICAGRVDKVSTGI